jgi:hypothetical protein
MKLIDKIIAYCKKVEKAERPKQSDKEEYSHGKYAVASSVLKLVELNQPEPPTLRPMSELPEVNEWVNVLIQHNDDLFWGDGCICLNRIELRYLGQDCWKNKNYISDEKVKALGWLPKEVLPNPDEIKLPC